jgi:hypothetical protein
VVLGAVIVVSTRGSTGDRVTVQTPSTLRPATVPSEPAEGRFVPPTWTDGTTTVMNATLLDGRRYQLRYPASADLASLGVAVSGAVDWDARGGATLRCCGRAVNARHLSLGEVWAGFLPTAVYEGADGSMVRYFDGAQAISDYYATPKLDYLVFQFGTWQIAVYDVKTPGDFEDRMTETERATWARSLGGRVTSDGYLVLEPRVPLQASPAGSSTVVFGTGRGTSDPHVNLEEGYCGQPESDTATRRRFDDLGQPAVAWCDPATGLHVSATGPAPFVDALADGLVITPLDPVR